MRAPDRSSCAAGVASARALLAAILLVVEATLSVSIVCADVPPGLSDPGPAGHAVKCQKLPSKGAAKFLGTWSKTYAKCLAAIASCVQTKGSDPVCLAKAADR